MNDRKAIPSDLDGELIEAMASHMREHHDRDFDLRRDVAYPGNVSPEKVFDWRARSSRGAAAFFCGLCDPEDGQMHLVGEPPRGTPARNAYLRRVDPKAQAAAALGTPEDEEWLTEAYDRGTLGRDLRGLIERQKGRADSSNRTLAKQERLKRFRAFFLPALEREGTIEGAIQSLIALHQQNPNAYIAKMGTDRLFGEGTFRDYVWESTAPAERRQAKAKWKAARQARRTRIP